LTPGGGLLGGQVAVMDLDGWTYERHGEDRRRRLVPVPSLGGGGRGGSRGDAGDAPIRTSRRIATRGSTRWRACWTGARARRQARRAGPTGDQALVPVSRSGCALLRASTEQDIRDAVAFGDRAGVASSSSGGIEAAMAAALLKEKNIR
jgi:hypothetical protein